MFPILTLEGMSHSSFMDKSMLPKFVLTQDIHPEVDEKTGYNMVAKSVLDFISKIEKKDIKISTSDMY